MCEYVLVNVSNYNPFGCTRVLLVWYSVVRDSHFL